MRIYFHSIFSFFCTSLFFGQMKIFNVVPVEISDLFQMQLIHIFKKLIKDKDSLLNILLF